MKKDKRYKITFVLILVLHLSLQFIYYNNSPFNAGELSIIDISSKDIDINYLRTGVPHPPLRLMIIRSWIDIFGIENIRLLPITFSLLSVIFIFKLGEALFNKKVGLYAAFFLAINPFVISQSRVVQSYTIFLFFVLLNFLAFVRWKEKKSKITFLGFMVSSILMAQTHFYSAFIFLTELIYTLTWNKGKIKELLLIFLIVLATLIPQAFLTLKYGAYDFPYNEPWHDITVPSAKYSIYMLYYYIIKEGIGIAGVMLLALFYALYLSEKKKEFLSNLIFILCPLTLFLLSFFIRIRAYQLIFLVPFYLIYLTKYAINKKRKQFMIALILTLSLLGFLNIQKETGSVKDISFIENNLENGDIIIVDGFEAFRIGYYSDLRYRNFSYLDISMPDKIIGSVEGRKWFLYTNEMEFNDKNYFNHSTISWLKEKCNKTEVENIFLCP